MAVHWFCNPVMAVRFCRGAPIIFESQLMILIAGDSWACGEFHSDWTKKEIKWDQLITHGGLSKFLRDDGYQVLNLAYPGGSNIGSSQRLQNYFVSNPEYQVEKVFVFQTDWCRDIDHFSNIGWETRPIGYFQLALAPVLNFDSCNHALHYRDVTLSRFYESLSKLGQTYDVDIALIGGLSDVLAYDRFSIEYPRVSCVCRSAVSLAVLDDADAEPLTTGFLSPHYDKMADYIKQQLSVDQISVLIDQIDLGSQRQQLFKNRLDLFPDRWHGGRQLHRKVYEFLKTKNII